ncbi:MFS transporter [Pseudomonas aeruginosa]|uniref:MFS transporter n=1 Tax=Pseudomonas aeruginosa TaxID=287 RepID=UPI00071BA77E|nr:MFS transporter [Pseudomonas aeruginosa]KSP13358.1 MFS transporter [Pseudomonas aeruginosa]
MNRPRTVIRFINAAHVIDHMFMLIFPAAVLGMAGSFDLDYAGLIGLSLGGFIAFGACSLPAGWLGDTWSRRRMMLLFFFGIGAAALLTGLAGSVPMLVTGLTLIGVFAAIYHPVGTAMLVAHAENRGREIGINGMWGNLGVAFAALLTGFFFCVREEPSPHLSAKAAARGEDSEGLSMRRVFGVLALVTATGGVVFNASTVTYPKLFQERLSDLLASPQTLGVVVSLAYAFGAVAQLIMGRLIDRLNLKLPFVFLTFCQVPLLLALAYGHGSAVVLFGALFMFAVFGQVTVNDAMVAHFVAPQWQARVFALRYFLSFGASAAAIPMIAYLEPRQGLLGLYLVLAGFAALTFAAALVFPRPARSAAVGT